MTETIPTFAEQRARRTLSAIELLTRAGKIATVDEITKATGDLTEDEVRAGIRKLLGLKLIEAKLERVPQPIRVLNIYAITPRGRAALEEAVAS